jgi:hypothetical protein
MRVVVQFEASGSWPDTLDAIADVKAAFYLRMADCLLERSGVGAAHATPAWVDVQCNGFLFRIVIYYPREVQLLQQRGDWRGAYALWFAMEEQPRLVSAMRGLALQYPAFGPTVSLLKRWLCAHLVPLEDEYGQAQASVSPFFFLGHPASHQFGTLNLNFAVTHAHDRRAIGHTRRPRGRTHLPAHQQLARVSGGPLHMWLLSRTTVIGNV